MKLLFEKLHNWEVPLGKILLGSYRLVNAFGKVPNIVFITYSQAYSNSPDEIKNNFIHLTNFSVNKNNEEFVYNENPGI